MWKAILPRLVQRSEELPCINRGHEHRARAGLFAIEWKITFPRTWKVTFACAPGTMPWKSTKTLRIEDCAMVWHHDGSVEFYVDDR